MVLHDAVKVSEPNQYYSKTTLPFFHSYSYTQIFLALHSHHTRSASLHSSSRLPHQHHSQPIPLPIALISLSALGIPNRTRSCEEEHFDGNSESGVQNQNNDE